MQVAQDSSPIAASNEMLSKPYVPLLNLDKVPAQPLETEQAAKEEIAGLNLDQLLDKADTGKMAEC